MHASIVMTVLATDRPGLVSTLSETIAVHGGSWQESAPMSGHPIFHATGRVSLAPGGDPLALIAAIENLGPDLSVSVAAES